MKKNALMIAALFAAGTMMSQDLTSKKGEMYLPEAGDYAIGIDADPLFYYLGNMFNGNVDNQAPSFNAHGNENGPFADGVTIYAKQFIDANTAYRAKARIGFNTTKDKMLVDDITPDQPGDEVENAVKNSNFGIVLGAGLEKRRGNTRLQGVYGAEAMIGLNSSKTTYDYGNSLEEMNSQLTEEKNGSMLMFGVGAFAGAEYFFAPKISIAGEYNFGINFTSTGDAETTTEFFNADTVTDTEAGNNSFGIDTGTLGTASLRLMLHF